MRRIRRKPQSVQRDRCQSACDRKPLERLSLRVGVTEDGIDAREIAVDPIDAVLRFVEVSIGVTVRDRMQFLLVQNGMMLNLRDSVGAKAGALITTLGQVEIKSAVPEIRYSCNLLHARIMRRPWFLSSRLRDLCRSSRLLLRPR